MLFILTNQIVDPLPVIWSTQEVHCLNDAISYRNSTSGISTRVPTTFDAWWSDKTVPIYLIFMFLPMLNLKDAVIFTKFNTLGTFSVAYITFLAIYKVSIWGINWRGPVSSRICPEGIMMNEFFQGN